ncbi:hypothetical protein GCM10027297_01500 [Parahaliea aestuarii]
MCRRDTGAASLVRHPRKAAAEALPQIDKAFARGESSYSRVLTMTRVATADNEDYLLMVARHGTASHMEKLVGKFDRVQKRQSEIWRTITQPSLLGVRTPAVAQSRYRPATFIPDRNPARKTSRSPLVPAHR